MWLKNMIIVKISLWICNDIATDKMKKMVIIVFIDIIYSVILMKT